MNFSPVFNVNLRIDQMDGISADVEISTLALRHTTGYIRHISVVFLFTGEKMNGF